MSTTKNTAMDQSLPVKRLEYCIPDTAAAAESINIRRRHSLDKYFHLVNVNIDFEKSNLSLEGDSQLMPGASRKLRLSRSKPGKERIKVKATIYPGARVQLSDMANRELVFCVEGIMEDGMIMNSCSGLLVLNNVTEGEGQGGVKWYLAVYLYDDYNKEREIKLRLTMHSLVENAELN